jgi:hypothetical protein
MGSIWVSFKIDWTANFIVPIRGKIKLSWQVLYYMTIPNLFEIQLAVSFVKHEDRRTSTNLTVSSHFIN